MLRHREHRCGIVDPNAVGTLVIVDDDTLDAVNLNRIINSTSADAGQKRPKVLAIKEAIDRIDFGTVLHAY